ncbi:MAG: hypothetical protein WCE52_15825 [Candidatus Acidiferrum sp.]
MKALSHDFFQCTLTSREQNHTNLPKVTADVTATYIAPCFETINQAHRAVVAEEQTIRELADIAFVISRERTQSKKQLVLLRLETGLLGCLLASSEEAPDAVA